MKQRWIGFALLLLLVVGPLAAQDEMAAADLRIGALPVINMLPLYVAQDAGYFDEAGIVVEIVDFTSGADVQAATIAGELDGFQADLFSALKVNAGGGDVRVVRHVGITEAPFISLLVGRRSGIEDVEDLAGKRVGLSRNTIIQYMTDQFLASAELDAAEAGVEYVDIPGIWDRLQQLLDREIDAATLPAPFSEVFPRWTYQVLIDDSEVAYVPESLNIAAAALAEKGEAVRAFLAAYERAVDTINELAGEPGALREFLRENDRGGGQVIKTALTADLSDLPRFTQARVPSDAEYQGAREWALGAGIVDAAPAYADMVDGSYLPGVVVEETPEEVVVEAAAPEEERREPDLRIAIRPSPNALPIYVARNAGYFEEAGVVVEVDNYYSGATQQFAIIAGGYDGFLYDSILNLTRLIDSGVDLRVVRELEVTNIPYFSIVTGPVSDFESSEDLAGQTVQVLQDSDAAYQASLLLESVGLADQVELDYVDSGSAGRLTDRILRRGDRLALVDAMSTQYILLYRGLALLDSDEIGFDGAQNLMGFRAEALAENGEAVRAFLSALSRAEETINALNGDSDAYRDLVEEQGWEEESYVESMISVGYVPVPIFAPDALPQRGDFVDIQEWAMAAGWLDAPVAYEELVDGRFLMEGMAEE